MSRDGEAGDTSAQANGSLVPNALRSRLITKVALGILVVLVLTAGISTVFYLGISDHLEHQVDEQIEQTTELHTSVVDNWVADREHDLEERQRLDVLRSSDEDEISRVLETESYSSDFDALHLVDSETGTIIASSDDDALERDFFEDVDAETTTQSTFISDEQYRSAVGESTIAIGQPHRDYRLNRLIVGEVDVAEGGPDLPQAIDGAATAVVTADGELVLGSADVDTAQADVAGDSVNTARDAVHMHDEGEHRYAASGLESHEFAIVTETPHETAFAVRDEVLWSFAATIVLSGVVLTAAGVAGGRSVSSDLSRLESRAHAMEDGDLSVELSTRRVDEIGSLYASFGAMRDSLRHQIETAQSAREDADAERERVEQINADLEAAAEEYCTVMEAAAGGELQARAAVETDNEAMQTIGTECNEMLAAIDATVADLQTFATQVALASEQVTASSEEVRTASEQISDSVQDIATGAEYQNDALQTVTTELSDLSATTEEIAASSSEVAAIAERTATAGQTGHEAATDALDRMNETESEAEQAVTEITALEDDVSQIDELIEQIQQLAEQTNMLALNANIEASRSEGGEETDGFGAVASEIKTLSADAKAAAQQVEDRLERIREQTGDSAAQVEATSERLATASEQVEQAVASLEEIATYADRTNVGVQEISTATQAQAATTQEVSTIVDETASIAAQTTTETEHVAAATEEQTAALTDVTDSATTLSTRATDLSNALEHFETTTEAPSRDSERVDRKADIGHPPATGAFEFDDSSETNK